jgi:hypothetical protein
MADIYLPTSTSDKTLILAAQQGMVRQFNFGTDWTEIRFGFLYSLIAADDDNSYPGHPTIGASAYSEILTYASVLDLPTIGLRNYSNATVPGQSGSRFIGVTSFANGGSYHLLYGTVDSSGGGGDGVLVQSSVGYLGAYGFYDTTRLGSSSQDHRYMFTPRAGGTSSYNGFYGIKFVLSNRGAASQSMAVSTCYTPSVSGTDYSKTKAKSLLLAFANPSSGASTVPWNDGASAYTVPDAFWIRLPFAGIRLRISSIVGLKIAPV